MNEATLVPMIEKLENVFSILNEHFYGNELEKPVITVSPDGKKKSLGWVTTWKAWKPGKEEAAEIGYYELNVSAEFLTRPFYEVVETMMHEMVHLWNIKHKIKDTNQNGSYHNKKYKEGAEAHGLQVEKSAKYGWSMTSLTENSLEYVKETFEDAALPLYRYQPEKAKKVKSNVRKYVCPCCGDSVRATKEVFIVCGSCDTAMIEE